APPVPSNWPGNPPCATTSRSPAHCVAYGDAGRRGPSIAELKQDPRPFHSPFAGPAARKGSTRAYSPGERRAGSSRFAAERARSTSPLPARTAAMTASCPGGRRSAKTVMSSKILKASAGCLCSSRFRACVMRKVTLDGSAARAAEVSSRLTSSSPVRAR
ncbi:MAG: hypothetical protein ACK55I_41875, partial [bacterium]